jgi:small subunit ribosomal protein S4
MKTAPKYKICRRLGSAVFEKCQTQKFVQSEARHKKIGGKKPKALSDYGVALIQKQKIRFSYNISEKQFRSYVKKAMAKKGIVPAENLFESLEHRLDNTVYRLGFGHTRTLTRQMTSHGHFTVNGKRTTTPSYQVREGDVIAVREGSRGSALFTEFAKKAKDLNIPTWLSLDAGTLSGKVVGKPKHMDSFLDFNAVLEFYSR